MKHVFDIIRCVTVVSVFGLGLVGLVGLGLLGPKRVGLLPIGTLDFDVVPFLFLFIDPPERPIFKDLL